MQAVQNSDNFQPTCATRDQAIFSTNIQTLIWTTSPGFNERLARQCLSIYEKKLQDKAGYQDYNLWHEDTPELKTLKNMFEQGIKGYVDAHLNAEVIREKFDAELHAWLRIDRPKQVISPHNHLGTAVAVTYYCQADIAARRAASTGYGYDIIEGDLILMDSAPVQLRFAKSENIVSISPETGMMVIMPGHLMHWVNPVSSGDVRICIANNLNLKRKTTISVPFKI